ncbi:TrkH family potassium uptake protein [Shimia thalassica]|uniref:TrkH family potassium uptake protein n=1 Tax=Shimia thalassica TaxID=1715693 RepID=UPI0026E48D44|nr:potassium transporter TrkG [Shimia thalassica]MDO6798247.1 potassium transporter TrkG [Shimia thalassica]
MLLALFRLPLFLLLIGFSGLIMLIPAVYAGVLHDLHEARSFFYSGILTLFVFSLIAVAMSDTGERPRALDHLVAVFLTFTVLPLVLALPFWEGLATTTFLNAYFEMVSCLTTTGATLFDNPDRLSPSLHLWRGLVGWFGGLLMWIAAVAVFAPLTLGGYEVTARLAPGQSGSHAGRIETVSAMRRWQRGLFALFPIYVGLTLTLWVLLLVLGEDSLAGLMHAMSAMSTSGISSIGGVANAKSGIGGEVVMFLFMLFALSRLTFSADSGAVKRDNLWTDPEFRLGILIVLAIPLFLFMRHWLGAYEFDELQNAAGAVHAAWGAMFTVLSFLTTTGFESSEWVTAQGWSGLSTPGMILLGLSIVGGGVATTAGGVKLLRVFVLYLQGLGEMQRLVHPSIVIADKGGTRHIRRQGAQIAWVFFMLFAISLAVVTVILAGLGASFEDSLIMAISMLTTTGPLTQVAGEAPIDLIAQSPWIKLVLSAAMVLGRLETLGIIALLSPELWHK